MRPDWSVHEAPVFAENQGCVDARTKLNRLVFAGHFSGYTYNDFESRWVVLCDERGWITRSSPLYGRVLGSVIVRDLFGFGSLHLSGIVHLLSRDEARTSIAHRKICNQQLAIEKNFRGDSSTGIVIASSEVQSTPLLENVANKTGNDER
jgi:hypothetical protein